jgi:hypothetical protein
LGELEIGRIADWENWRFEIWRFEDLETAEFSAKLGIANEESDDQYSG